MVLSSSNSSKGQKSAHKQLSKMKTKISPLKQEGIYADPSQHSLFSKYQKSATMKQINTAPVANQAPLPGQKRYSTSNSASTPQEPQQKKSKDKQLLFGSADHSVNTKQLQAKVLNSTGNKDSLTSGPN
jgi:hypothetical protein